MKKKIAIAIAATCIGMLAVGCGNHKRGAVRGGVVSEADTRSVKLDYTGTYHGMLPCADCGGIRVTLEIKPNGTFEMKTVHLADREGMKDIHTEYEGNYTWNENDGVVLLQNITTQPNRYLYTDDSLIQLDMNGNRISGPLADRYILKK